MIRLQELLEHPVYQTWIEREPQARREVCQAAPWEVFVQLEQGGRWRAKVFNDYLDGLKLLMKAVDRDVWNGALSARRREHAPPMIKVRLKDGNVGKIRWKFPRPNNERWCPYCRRPTTFKVYDWHHAINRNESMRDVMVMPELRCSICGIRWGFLTRRARTWSNTRGQ